MVDTGRDAVSAAGRIAALDILRGVAVFGIILSDIDSVFRILTTGDRTASFLYSFFVWDRFWPLFSFLFGLGFGIQMLRAESRGGSFVWTYVRRLIVLLLFGAANVVLLSQIWRGDFLHQYAALGFLLLLVRRWSPRAILVLALVCFLVPTVREAVAARRVLVQPAGAQQALGQAQPPAPQAARAGSELRRLRSEGSYAEVAVFAARRFFVTLGRWQTYLGWLGRTFPLFLIGMYVGRRQMFESVDEQSPFLRRVLWWSLGLGVVGGLSAEFLSGGAIAASSGSAALFTRLLERAGGPGLSLFYASGIVLLLQRTKWRTWLAPFSAVGQTALSNYLFQATAFALICSGYGLGQYHTLSPLAGVGLACGIFLIELGLSNWWMRRFRFGPAEWVWRSATYRSWQPMRAQQPSDRAVSA